MKNSKGFSLLEVLIASAIGVFLFFVVFYVLGSVISKGTLIEKETELVNVLDKRIDEFMLSGTFDSSPDGNISFSEASKNNGLIREFTATNNVFSLQVSKDTYASISALEAGINALLGPYMQRANEIYIAVGATVIDDPVLLNELQIARDTLLPVNTSMWSSQTAVLLNIGNGYAGPVAPLDNPLVDANVYITVAPFTNADVTSEGVTWRCTSFGLDTELLPSWCVL